MRKILFFDDFLINRQRNLMRRWHRPEWLKEYLFIDRDTSYGCGFASVVPAPTGGYYLYYVNCLPGNAHYPDDSAVLCLAESEDDLHWRNHHDLQGALDVLKDRGGWTSCARIQIQMDQAELFSINGNFGVTTQSGKPGKDYL